MRRRQRDSDERERSKTPITVRKIVESLKSPESTGNMASQKPTTSKSASASATSTNTNTNHDRSRSVILQPKSNPVMSFAYGAPVLPGVNDGHGHTQHGQSPRRSRGRAGSTAGGGSGDGHSEASTSRRTASNYPGAKNGDTSSPKNSRSNRIDDDDDESNVIRQEPAAVRYARLKQRLKDTGSSRPPADNNEEDDSEAEAAHASEQPEESAKQKQQRGNGTGVIQHNEPPKESSYKDTSVNIATAFWQAAGGPARTAMPAPRPAQAAIPNETHHNDHHEEDDASHAVDDVSATQSPEQSSVGRKEYPNPITSGKKRKKPTGAYKGTTSEKDRPFKISKKDLNKGSSSDDSEGYEEEGEIDLDELKFEMGYGPARKTGSSSATGAARAVRKPRAKQVNKTAGEEATTASTTKARRKSTQNKDGAYKPGQDDDDEEDEDDFDDSTSTRRKSSKGKGKARETSVAASEQSRGVSEAPSAGGQSMTSYYLQEPEVSTVSAVDKSTRLTQIHPKTNTYQPYFAFSTTTASLSKSSQNRPRAPSSSTNQSSIPDSTRGGTGNGTRAGVTSSNASFNERGSEYDYAEEERMLATLQAAKERAENGRLLPEGRPFSSLVGGNEKTASHHREVSLDTSEDSRDNMAHTQAGQAQQKQQTAVGQRKLGPRRGPPPPNRESSILSESASSQLNGYTTPAPHDLQSSDIESSRSIGRKLGQLVRKLFVILYWITVGPYKVIKGQDLNTLLKWAAAVGFTALVLAAMQEQRPSYSSPPSATRRWHVPFISSSPSSSSDFSAPNGLPSNLDELVARLTNLEASFSSLSSKQSSDHLHMFENTRSASETVKRLTMLEADFEAERRKIAKMNEGNKKEMLKAEEKVEANLKGVKTQLDYLAEKVKTLSGDRKADALDTAKLKDGVSTINKDISSLSRRLADLQKELETGHDSDNIAVLVSKAIEEILPSRMAVSVDAKSGQVQVDPNFWQHLRTAFSSSSADSGEGQAGKVLASWDDFLVANQQSLQRFIGDDVDARFNQGAILSKKAFTDILSKEIEGLRTELSQSSLDSLSKLSSDFSAKLAKATSSSGKAAASIKLSSGEDLNAIVMQLIESALEKYSKDVLAKPDFALYSAGGRIIPSLTSPTYEIRPNTFTGSLLSKITGRGVIRGRAPVTALHPDISVGQCWPFAGQSGQLGILLSRKILPEDITIEHASKDVALNVSSAPKRFEVWGLIEDQETMEKLASSFNTAEGEQERLLGNRLLLVSGEYDINASSHIQTFPIDQAVRDLEVPVNVVIVRILENHGNEALSCLYRVRVGGTVVEEEM